MKNKLFIIISLAILINLTITSIVLAQENEPQLPPTAVEAVEQVALLLAALGVSAGGYLGNLLMDFLKHSTPWLSKEKREAMGRGVTRIIALALAEIAGVISLLIMDYALQLDETGLWGALVTLSTIVGSPLLSEVLHRWRQVSKGPIYAELEAK